MSASAWGKFNSFTKDFPRKWLRGNGRGGNLFVEGPKSKEDGTSDGLANWQQLIKHHLSTTIKETGYELTWMQRCATTADKAPK